MVSTIIDFASFRKRVPLQKLSIECPVCHSQQAMALDAKSKVWFPVPPFCCDIMRHADTDNWNRLLDSLIAKEINKKHALQTTQ